MQTLGYGFPKIGKKREFKTLLENFWKGLISEEDLLKGIADLKLKIAQLYSETVDRFTGNEVSLYDFMLDTAIMVGAIPQRFLPYEGLSTYFKMAKGKNALELTKWFNTNYHYLVPEIEKEDFFLFENLVIKDFVFYKTHNFNALPKLIGPFTFLKLSKIVKNEKGSKTLKKIDKKEEFEKLIPKLTETYITLFTELFDKGAFLVILEEPGFVLDLEPWEWDLILEAYQEFKKTKLEIWILTYYESVSDYQKFIKLPVKGLGLDFVSNKENFDNLKRYGFPEDKILIAGVINGRQVWKTDLEKTLYFLEDLHKVTKNIVISNSCPLYHLPISLEGEEHLPSQLKEKLSFAKEKLEELKMVKLAWEGDPKALLYVKEIKTKLKEPFPQTPSLSEKIVSLTEKDFTRDLPYEERIKLQQQRLNLPLFPTTTIGSFPQTKEIRTIRARFNKGEITEEEYKNFIRKKIEEVIRLQEELGLDVLVHGEFERSDMVEFFAKKLEGVATTKEGWVLSYGSRVYRPPIIYGDVLRNKPLILEETLYAQSLTNLPVKGILTGPVTILTWSFYREDIPKSHIAFQIALALLEEVKALEEAGIKIVQIDEPAFREGAPIKRKDWDEYFDWAIKAFRLCSKAKPETQIHTHMCYSDFHEILPYLNKMDFDVISLEISRSKGEALSVFKDYKNWKRQVGVGVYDVHSPDIPTKEEIKEIIYQALKYLPKELIWINPDCGLKTRNWEEVIPALKNMIQATKELRKEIS